MGLGLLFSTVGNSRDNVTHGTRTTVLHSGKQVETTSHMGLGLLFSTVGNSRDNVTHGTRTTVLHSGKQ